MVIPLGKMFFTVLIVRKNTAPTVFISWLIERLESFSFIDTVE